ncbi:unnamed protein product [Leptidea sinapis]|uniref:Uncharacterized protein n=1 Tax=Leptidea sinapis TaxID=189913 RepID=A0A5E4QFB3_9NEOP|nr:unnamed protein product [Leptidea sinapis]
MIDQSVTRDMTSERVTRHKDADDIMHISGELPYTCDPSPLRHTHGYNGDVKGNHIHSGDEDEIDLIRVRRRRPGRDPGRPAGPPPATGAPRTGRRVRDDPRAAAARDLPPRQTGHQPRQEPVHGRAVLRPLARRALADGSRRPHHRLHQCQLRRWLQTEERIYMYPGSAPENVWRFLAHGVGAGQRGGGDDDTDSGARPGQVWAVLAGDGGRHRHARGLRRHHRPRAARRRLQQYERQHEHSRYMSSDLFSK